MLLVTLKLLLKLLCYCLKAAPKVLLDASKLPFYCLKVASKVLQRSFDCFQAASKLLQRCFWLLQSCFSTDLKLLQSCFKGAFGCFKAGFSLPQCCFEGASKVLFVASKLLYAASECFITASQLLLIHHYASQHNHMVLLVSHSIRDTRPADSPTPIPAGEQYGNCASGLTNLVMNCGMHRCVPMVCQSTRAHKLSTQSWSCLKAFFSIRNFIGSSGLLEAHTAGCCSRMNELGSDHPVVTTALLRKHAVCVL